MIQVLGVARRRLAPAAIPASLGSDVAGHQGVRGRGDPQLQAASGISCGGAGEEPGRAAQLPSGRRSARSQGRRGSHAGLSTPRGLGVGSGVGGGRAGTQALAALPDRPAPATPWSASSTPWWQRWSRWRASPARAGRDTWRGWRRFTARCWGRRRPPEGAAAVSGGRTGAGSAARGPCDGPARGSRKQCGACPESACVAEAGWELGHS